MQSHHFRQTNLVAMKSHIVISHLTTTHFISRHLTSLLVSFRFGRRMFLRQWKWQLSHWIELNWIELNWIESAHASTLRFRRSSSLYDAQWARMKPNCAKTVFILNFAADSSGALKCSFFYLLCSPFRLNNEMLTMHRQICLKTAETSPENCKWLQSTRIYAAKFYMTES